MDEKDSVEIPQERNEAQKNAIRTFEGDAAEALKKGQTSLGSIFLAEKARQRTQGNAGISEPSKRQAPFARTILSIGGALLALLIIGGGYVLLRGTEEPGASAFRESIVFSEKILPLDAGTLSREDALKAVANERRTAKLELGSIEEVVVGRTVASGAGTTTVALRAADFFETLGVTPPASLTRSLDGDLMFGLHAFNGIQPFLILRLASYEPAFAGMLEWERDMAVALAGIITPRDTTLPPQGLPWNDALVSNVDVRQVSGADGNVLLLYAFIDRRTLVMTTNSNTLKEVLNRLSTAKFER